MNSQNPDWITRTFGKDLVVDINEFVDEIRSSGKCEKEVAVYREAFEHAADMKLHKRVYTYAMIGLIFIYVGIGYIL